MEESLQKTNPGTSLDEHQERLSTLGEMAAVLAHEIKNPMNSIIINLEVLKSTLPKVLPEEENLQLQKAEKYLSVIEREMKRLDNVIKSFLDLAAPPKKGRQAFDLNQIVLNNFELIRLELEQQNIEWHLELAEGMPHFHGNADQVRQAVLNLLLNAVQAMPEGGRITVTSAFDAKTLTLSIQDTGMGIKESIRSQIFSPYFTTKKKGSGLGLAIVRRILREHGGCVDVESEEGQGSRFHLVFPRNDRES